MKKVLFSFAIVLIALATQAQTAFKIHSDGQISLQSATSSYGIQIPSTAALWHPKRWKACSATWKKAERQVWWPKSSKKCCQRPCATTPTVWLA